MKPCTARRSGTCSVSYQSLNSSSSTGEESKPATSNPMVMARGPSVDPDAGFLHDRRPLRDFGPDEFAEFLRRPADRLEPELDHAFRHVGRRDDLVEVGVEPADDLRRDSGGREHAVPRSDFVTGN